MTKLLLYPLLALALLLLPSCSSGTDSSEEKSPSYFPRYAYLDEIKKNASNCAIDYLTPDHEPLYWQSKRFSESDKYSWIEYNPILDYYDFRLEDDDDSYKSTDLEDVTSTQKCIDFLRVDIQLLNKYEQINAQKLRGLYQDLIENRQSYLEQSKLMASTEINKANRAKYLDLEDAKVSLNKSSEVIFFEIRKLIDYVNYEKVKVFLERCPDAFSILGKDTQIDGSILLTNFGSGSQTVSMKVLYKDSDGVLVGSSSIYETVPGNSKMRVGISAAGSSGPVGAGATFPAVCTIQFYRS
jgi:hypothetical protein